MTRFIYESLTDIPSGFTEVEYLEGTGTQYIDTGVVFSNSSHTYKWDIGVQAVNTSDTNYNWFCGFFEGGANSAGTYADNTTNYRFYAVGTYYQNGQVITTPLTNGDKYGIIRNVFTITNFAGTLPVILFGRNQSNGVKCEATKKVFYYKIYDNDTLIRDFIPCLDTSNVPCMWDRVEKKAYYNAGTGSFTYGRKIIPVEYLESTGTQYIDTGYIPNQNTYVELNAMYTALDSTYRTPFSVRTSDGAANSFTIAGATNTANVYAFGSQYWSGDTGCPIAYTNIKYFMSLKSGEANFNGVKHTAGTTITPTTLTAYMFARNANGTVGNFLKGLIYNCLIKENSTVIHEYYPAKDENGVGFMLDRVTHTCLLNQGTGSFLVGKQFPTKKIRFLNTTKRIVPKGFQEVEYLASNSNQWIDTGYKMTDGKSSTFEGRIMWTASHGTANFFYGYRSVNSAEYHGDMRAFFIYGTTTTPPGRIAIRYGVDTENSTTQSVYLNQACRISFDGVNFKVNDTTVVTHSKTYSPANYQNMWLFNCNCTGYYSADVSHFVGRIYRWTIYEEGVAVRDFIPYLDDNGRPCMWDSVEGKAYYNIGTGEFTYGRKIIPIEYIESSGTQYIDAGFTPNQDSKVELTYQISNDLSSGFPLFGSRTSASSNGYSYQRYGAGVMGGQYGANITQSTVAPDSNIHTVVRDANKIYLDGTEIVSQSIATFTCPGNLYINAMNNNGTAAIQNCGVKYYSCRIWGSDLARDFIPCKDENGVGYLFDKVSHMAFTNSGTGSFICGNTLFNTGDVNRLLLYDKLRIPSSYTEVEYLEGTGTQWLDIGTTIDTATDEVELYFQLTESNNYKWIFGEHDDNARFGLGSGDGSNKRNVAYYSSTVKVNDSDMYNNQHYFKADSTGAYLDGTKKANYASFSSTSTLYMFNLNLSQATYTCSGKVWAFRQKRNGVLIRDLVPCLDNNNVPCMYDRVTGTSIYNSGTGEFTYGHTILPVEYLESSGTQYIDTGYTSNNIYANSAFEVTCETSDLSNRVVGCGGLSDNNKNISLSFSSGGYILALYGDKWTSNIFSYSTNTKYKIKFEVSTSQQKLYVNDNLIDTTTYSWNSSNNYPLRLFKTNADTYTKPTKIYSFKLWISDTLVRDFIPCKDENGVGFMFDLVTHAVFQNLGTGSFIMGKRIK